MLNREFVSFCIIGFLAYIVDVMVVSFLKETVGFYYARIPSFLCAATVTWLLNRRYTFIEKSGKIIIEEYIFYLSLMGLGGVINNLVYFVSIYFLSDWDYSVFVAVALGSISGLLVNFFNSKHYVFNGIK